MQPFTTLTSIAASLPAADVDTDIIFPARFLLHTQKAGLSQFAFYDWRYHADGRENHAFALNRPDFVGAQILIAGPNFGCGSGREQASWAMFDLGFRCVIAESFGEIFLANCFRNGMLPIAAPETVVAKLADLAEAGRPITIDLVAQQVLADGRVIHEIGIDPVRRRALLNGWNDTSVSLNAEGVALDQFDAKMRQVMPWLFGDTLLETPHG